MSKLAGAILQKGLAVSSAESRVDQISKSTVKSPSRGSAGGTEDHLENAPQYLVYNDVRLILSPIYLNVQPLSYGEIADLLNSREASPVTRTGVAE